MKLRHLCSCKLMISCYLSRHQAHKTADFSRLPEGATSKSGRFGWYIPLGDGMVIQKTSKRMKTQENFSVYLFCPRNIQTLAGFMELKMNWTIIHNGGCEAKNNFPKQKVVDVPQPSEGVTSPLMYFYGYLSTKDCPINKSYRLRMQEA